MVKITKFDSFKVVGAGKNCTNTLCSEATKHENFLDKKYAKIIKPFHVFKCYASSLIMLIF